MRKLASIFFLAFAVLPLAAGLVYALLYSLGLVGALAGGFTVNAWTKLLQDPGFLVSLGLSALISLLGVVVSTALALVLVTRLDLDRPRIRLFLHFPLALPPIIAAFISFQWFGSSGILARLAWRFGWIENVAAFPPLINDPFYIGVGLTMILLTFPFLLLLFLNYYQVANLPQLSQLATTLGASSAYIRRHLIQPILLRRVLPTLLLYVVFLFGAYEVPLLLGRQSPAMISIFISQKFGRFNLSDLPIAYAATVVYTVLVFSVVIVFLQLNKPTAQS